MESQIAVIIPVYNLIQRGLERVRCSLYSIALNSIVPGVVIMDGSAPEHYDTLHGLIEEFSFVEHVRYPQHRYNMPILFNRGIERTTAPYLFCTGADFLYRNDFFATLQEQAHENRFIVVPVGMLPIGMPSDADIEAWALPPATRNPYGKWADGLQCFHRSWYDYAGGYDERMYGWGGMDNDHHFRAKRYGLRSLWLKGSEVLHIGHAHEKTSGPDRAEKIKQTERNWRLRDTDTSIRRNRPLTKEIRFRPHSRAYHMVNVIVRDTNERIQSTWHKGEFYEAGTRDMLPMIYQHFQRGTFVDVGAAVGNHTLFFARCCKARAVLAFEPVQVLHQHLVENVKANGLDTVRTYAIALGEANGTVGLVPSQVPAEQGGLMMTQVDPSGDGVPIETLDAVLAREAMDTVTCLKIDTQGHELPVLKGARQTLERQHPAIFCTCPTKEQYAAIDAFLKPLGYRVRTRKGQPLTMNPTPTYWWSFVETVDLIIVITTYNRPDTLARLVESLMAEAEGYRVRCLIYDDHSSTSYDSLPDETPTFQITYTRFSQRHGKQGYWRLITSIWNDLKAKEARYYIQLPDDIALRPGFIKHAIETYEAISDPQKISLNLYLDEARIGIPNWTPQIPKIERYNGHHVFNTGWNDLCYIAEKRFFEALDYQVKPVPSTRWRRDPKLSSGVGLQVTERLQGYKMYQVRECFLGATGVKSQMNPRRPTHEDVSVASLDRILCGVASLPDRVANLKRTVASILPYVDALHVYLNGHTAVPAFLQNPKIVVHRSQEHGDLGDGGKFFSVGNHRGYYVAIDDDIVYPPDYVWTLINHLRRYRGQGKKVAVGLHGKVMAQRVTHFYTNHAIQYHCAQPLRQAQGVHVLGTGTLAFHTDDLPLTVDDFKKPPNMADIHFSLKCQQHGVGCVALPRRRNYITIQNIPNEKTIWGKYHRNDGAQTRLFNSWKNWKIRV